MMGMRMSEWPTTCQRCGDPLAVSSMSFFNEDVCCVPCLDDERDAPTYAAARAAEAQAVRNRNYNFSAGLTPADRSFLAARLAARRRDLRGFNEAATSLGYAILGAAKRRD
jgi:hypothetical protein